MAVLGKETVREPEFLNLLGRGNVIAHVEGNHWVRVRGTVQDGGSTWIRIYDPGRGNYEQLLSSFLTGAGRYNRMILVIH